MATKDKPPHEGEGGPEGARSPGPERRRESPEAELEKIEARLLHDLTSVRELAEGFKSDIAEFSALMGLTADQQIRRAALALEFGMANDRVEALVNKVQRLRALRTGLKRLKEIEDEIRKFRRTERLSGKSGPDRAANALVGEDTGVIEQEKLRAREQRERLEKEQKELFQQVNVLRSEFALERMQPVERTDMIPRAAVARALESSVGLSGAEPAKAPSFTEQAKELSEVGNKVAEENRFGLGSIDWGGGAEATEEERELDSVSESDEAPPLISPEVISVAPAAPEPGASRPEPPPLPEPTPVPVIEITEAVEAAALESEEDTVYIERVVQEAVVNIQNAENKRKAESQLRDALAGLNREKVDEWVLVMSDLAYQRTLPDYLALKKAGPDGRDVSIVADDTASICFKRARYFVDQPQEKKEEMTDRALQMARRLESLAQKKGYPASVPWFGQDFQKYFSSMLLDVVKYQAHVDGAVIIRNPNARKRGRTYNTFDELKAADFIRSSRISLDEPRSLISFELREIIDNSYFDASPLGDAPDAHLRRELSIERMMMWLEEETRKERGKARARKAPDRVPDDGQRAGTLEKILFDDFVLPLSEEQEKEKKVHEAIERQREWYDWFLRGLRLREPAPDYPQWDESFVLALKAAIAELAVRLHGERIGSVAERRVAEEARLSSEERLAAIYDFLRQASASGHRFNWDDLGLPDSRRKALESRSADMRRQAQVWLEAAERGEDIGGYSAEGMRRLVDGLGADIMGDDKKQAREAVRVLGLFLRRAAELVRERGSEHVWVDVLAEGESLQKELRAASAEGREVLAHALLPENLWVAGLQHRILQAESAGHVDDETAIEVARRDLNLLEQWVRISVEANRAAGIYRNVIPLWQAAGMNDLLLTIEGEEKEKRRAEYHTAVALVAAVRSALARAEATGKRFAVLRALVAEHPADPRIDAMLRNLEGDTPREMHAKEAAAGQDIFERLNQHHIAMLNERLQAGGNLHVGAAEAMLNFLDTVVEPELPSVLGTQLELQEAEADVTRLEAELAEYRDMFAGEQKAVAKEAAATVKARQQEHAGIAHGHGHDGDGHEGHDHGHHERVEVKLAASPPAPPTEPPAPPREPSPARLGGRELKAVKPSSPDKPTPPPPESIRTKQREKEHRVKRRLKGLLRALGLVLGIWATDRVVDNTTGSSIGEGIHRLVKGKEGSDDKLAAVKKPEADSASERPSDFVHTIVAESVDRSAGGVSAKAIEEVFDDEIDGSGIQDYVMVKTMEMLRKDGFDKVPRWLPLTADGEIDWEKMPDSADVQNNKEAILDAVDAAVEKHHVPKEIILAVIIRESQGRAEALSADASAKGLMQLKNIAIDDIGGLQGRDVYKIADNVDMGTKYLDKMYGRFHDWPLALAAYKDGAATMRKLIQEYFDRVLDIQFNFTDENADAYVRDFTLLRTLEEYGVNITMLNGHDGGTDGTRYAFEVAALAQVAPKVFRKGEGASSVEPDAGTVEAVAVDTASVAEPVDGGTLRQGRLGRIDRIAPGEARERARAIKYEKFELTKRERAVLLETGEVFASEDRKADEKVIINIAQDQLDSFKKRLEALRADAGVGD